MKTIASLKTVNQNHSYMKKKILAGCLLLLVSLMAVTAQDAKSAKQKDIKKLMDLTGSGDLGVQVVKQMVASFKVEMPNVPQKFWDDFMKEVKGEDLVNLVIPIYDKHFSHEDIKGLIAFYESPVGKKFVSKLPAITQESMTVGQLWGQKIGEKAAKKLEEKGYKQKL